MIRRIQEADIDRVAAIWLDMDRSTGETEYVMIWKKEDL